MYYGARMGKIGDNKWLIKCTLHAIEVLVFNRSWSGLELSYEAVSRLIRSAIGRAFQWYKNRRVNPQGMSCNRDVKWREE